MKDILLQRMEELEVNINNKLMLLEKNLKDHSQEVLAPIKEEINNILIKMQDCSDKLGQDHVEIMNKLDRVKTLLLALLLLNAAELLLILTLLFR